MWLWKTSLFTWTQRLRLTVEIMIGRRQVFAKGSLLPALFLVGFAGSPFFIRGRPQPHTSTLTRQSGKEKTTRWRTTKSFPSSCSHIGLNVSTLNKCLVLKPSQKRYVPTSVTVFWPVILFLALIISESAQHFTTSQEHLPWKQNARSETTFVFCQIQLLKKQICIAVYCSVLATA